VRTGVLGRDCYKLARDRAGQACACGGDRVAIDTMTERFVDGLVARL
jgi:hypothetical protein